MTYVRVQPVADCVVHPDKHWLEHSYNQVACSRCHQLPYDRRLGIDIIVQDKLKGPSCGVWKFVCAEMLRTDMHEALCQYMNDHYYGKVFVRDQEQQNYISVVWGESVRMPMYGDERSVYAKCKECGRDNKRELFGLSHFRASDIGNCMLFTSHGGAGIHMHSDAYNSLPDKLLRELRWFPVSVL